MSFKANYFDGKSSKTHKATVTPNSVGWKISYTDELLGTVDVSWNLKAIQKSEVYTNGLVSFKYGEHFPFQKLESSDKQFISYINKSELSNLNNKVDNWLQKSAFKSIAILLTAIVGFAIGMYFYVLPSIAVNFAKNLPKESVIDFGNYVFRVLSPNLEINETQSKKLQSFVDEMKLDNEFPLTVYVADNNELNAFALSGGKFVIYTGLLNKIKNEHQLAALIGHEVSHIENRHVLKNVSRNLSGAIFVSIIFGDVSSATAILGENAHHFMQLSHTRDLEKEADNFGLKIMKANNLDQHGMPELFQILKDETNVDIPSFLSSHPILNDRIRYTKKVADSQNKTRENLILKEKWKLIQESITIDEDSDSIINNKSDD
ncbi:MAG: M48 family metallopeptidase [Tenacibaculum sp.]